MEAGEKSGIKPIYEYEDLPAGYDFIRCHQTHLINKKFIKSYAKTDGGFLLLQVNTEVPVSKNKKDFIKQQLENAGK